MDWVKKLDSNSLYNYIIVLVFILYALITLMNAWICDDIYITYRTIDNFVNGYGLTWNIGERVQTYTHPLWLALLTFFYVFTKEVYFTTIIISFLFSVVTAYLIVSKLSVDRFNSLLTLFILMFSKSYMDFSTSGLENPFSHLLVVVFIVVYLIIGNESKYKFLIPFIASLIALNRLDLFLIVLPALIYDLLKSRKLFDMKYYLIGCLPLIIWEIFSLLYYGFPFPNTAYAKLNTGIARYDLVIEGLNYFKNSFYIDPITLMVIFVATMTTLLIGEKKKIAIILGIWFYFIYLVSIGGDYMSGRFFSTPFIISVALISTYKIKYNPILIILSVLILGLFAPSPPPLTGTFFWGAGVSARLQNAFRIGPVFNLFLDRDVTDERYMASKYFGFLRIITNKAEEQPWKAQALIDKKASKIVYYCKNIGIYGYYIGPEKYLIDPYAIGDPLLSKLPTDTYWWIGHKRPPNSRLWRIGHFARQIPEGYMETQRNKYNSIKNEYLRAYYNHLSILIKGNIFSIKRLSEIWNFNVGKYNFLLDKYINIKSTKQN